MKRAAKQIAVLALGLIVFCLIFRLIGQNTFRMQLNPANWQTAREDLRVESSAPEIAHIGEIREENGRTFIAVHPDHYGDTDISVLGPDGEVLAYLPIRVSPFGTVFDMSTGNFTGDHAILLAVTAFFLLTNVILIWYYKQAKGPRYYSYSTVYYAGFAQFSLIAGLACLLVTVQYFLDPYYNMMQAYQAINGVSRLIMLYTSPLLTLFALMLIVSNIVLLRHEHMRLHNILGLTAGLLLIGGEVLGLVMCTQDFMGSEWEWRVQNTLVNMYTTAFAYFECMLIGAVLCSLQASRHRPSMDRDCIIILGCYFRKDGSLPPLLRGRVDEALRFWEAEKRASGKEALFLPSGGQGPDESMPEAEAMRRYLLEQHVNEVQIHPESQSRNTFQNMSCSKEIIDAEMPGAKVIYATSDYHVFRSGVWAARAGLEAEGIGAKTKWWFWPNAFIREVIGLFVNRWKEELIMMVMLVVYFGLLSMVLA